MYQVPSSPANGRPSHGLGLLKNALIGTGALAMFNLAKYGPLALRYWRLDCVTGPALYRLVLAPIFLLAVGLSVFALGRRWQETQDRRLPLVAAWAIGNVILLALFFSLSLLSLSRYDEPIVAFGIAIC